MPGSVPEAVRGPRPGSRAGSPPIDPAALPVTDRWRYLNHAGVAPLPAASVKAMADDAQDVALNGALTEDEREERSEAVRASAADLMGVPAERVAFVKNTTEGLGFVANGLEWQPGDRVVVPDLEFPSTLFPWLGLRDRGVVVDLVCPQDDARSLPVDAFGRALERGPARVVALSWVQFARGWRTDLAALAGLCHDHGALLCVDVIQGLGIVPCRLAEWGVDFAAADSHKWLLGPEGIGVFYVAEAAQEQLRVLEPGWNSVVGRQLWDDLTYALDPNARRFEGGTMNTAGIAGLGASLDLLAGAGEGGGIAAVWQHVDGLLARLCDGLEQRGAVVWSDRTPEGRSAIVTFAVPGMEGEAVVDRLQEAGVVCSPRSGGVRVSPHGYNTDGDIDALLDVVDRLA